MLLGESKKVMDEEKDLEGGEASDEAQEEEKEEGEGSEEGEAAE